MPYQKYFKWLFLVEHSSLSPGVNILFGSWVKPAPCRIPCPVCDTSSIAPPNGFVTTPIRPFPTPVMTPLAASLTSLARRIPWMGWSTIPATAPRRLRPNPPKPWDKPAWTTQVVLVFQIKLLISKGKVIATYFSLRHKNARFHNINKKMVPYYTHKSVFKAITNPFTDRKESYKLKNRSESELVQCSLLITSTCKCCN